MADREDILFHSERADAELERAMAAGSPKAAQAHLQLSALHLEKLRVLADAPAGAGAMHAY